MTASKKNLSKNKAKKINKKKKVRSTKRKTISKRPKKNIKLVSVRKGTIKHGEQGQNLILGVSHNISGSNKICGALVVMEPGKIAKPHLHRKNETIIFILEGWAATLSGPNLEPIFHGPGDFLYIPEKVEHSAVNLSSTDRVIALEMRTEKHFNEDVVLIPKLFQKAEEIAADLRMKFAAGLLPLPPEWRKLLGRPYTHI